MSLTNNEMKTQNYIRRNLPGTKLQECNNWPILDLQTANCPLALQEHLQDLLNHKISKENLIKTPFSVSKHAWIYEHSRQLCLELNFFVVFIKEECNALTCPEMRAEEWFYLCASHSAPQKCCAIDYIVHTLDASIAILNSNKIFPNRNDISESSFSVFQSIYRRLSRIFSHAYYHHIGIFDKFEAETQLYKRFEGLCLEYGILSYNTLNEAKNRNSKNPEDTEKNQENYE